jgi:hypothetical protein
MADPTPSDFPEYLGYREAPIQVPCKGSGKPLIHGGCPYCGRRDDIDNGEGRAVDHKRQEPT